MQDNHIFPSAIMLLEMYEIYFNQGNSIFRNSKIFFHWMKYVRSLQTLTKADEFDKRLITRTTRITTPKSILRPLPQYLLPVKNV